MDTRVETQEVACASTDAASPHEAPPSIALKLINLATVIIPLLGLATAIILLWGVAFNWVYLAILVSMYLLTGIGVTVGYHRLFTHRSFKAPRPVAIVLAALGSMAVEGPVLQWVATHRKHHQHSDKDGDPHSPHTHGDGLWNFAKGVWHAHMGWIIDAQGATGLRGPRAAEATGPTAAQAMRDTLTIDQADKPGKRGVVPPSLAKYVKDLERDASYRWMSRTFPLWVLLGLLIPAALGGLLTWSWTGILLGFLWGGLVRVLLLHHVTWSINSVCHIWGSRPFRCHDHSRNNFIFGVLALGEGWHNNHHAFPASARHGLKWWQFDFSFLVIWLMSKVGLASEVRVPSPDLVEAKRAK